MYTDPVEQVAMFAPDQLVMYCEQPVTQCGRKSALNTLGKLLQ